MPVRPHVTSLLLLSILLIGSPGLFPHPAEAGPGLLVYLAYDNSFSGMIEADLAKLSVLPNPPMPIYVFIDQPDSLPLTLHLAAGMWVRDSAWWTNPSSGDPQTLATFIRSAARRAGLTEAYLILSGHGTGWSRPGEIGEFGWEQSSGRAIRIRYNELTWAITSTGLPIRLLLLDACMMGGIEVAWSLRGGPEVLVASPGFVFSSGYPWERMVNDLASGERDPMRLGRSLIRAYAQSYAGNPSAWQLCATVLRPDSLPAIADLPLLWRDLSDSLLSALRASCTTWTNSPTSSPDDESPFLDARNFFTLMGDAGYPPWGTPDLWRPGDTLQAAWVTVAQPESLYPGARLSVWFPIRTAHFQPWANDYALLDWAYRGGWAGRLNLLYGPDSLPPGPGFERLGAVLQDGLLSVTWNRQADPSGLEDTRLKALKNIAERQHFPPGRPEDTLGGWRIYDDTCFYSGQARDTVHTLTLRFDPAVQAEGEMLRLNLNYWTHGTNRLETRFYARGTPITGQVWSGYAPDWSVWALPIPAAAESVQFRYFFDGGGESVGAYLTDITRLAADSTWLLAETPDTQWIGISAFGAPDYVALSVRDSAGNTRYSDWSRVYRLGPLERYTHLMTSSNPVLGGRFTLLGPKEVIKGKLRMWDIAGRSVFNWPPTDASTSTREVALPDGLPIGCYWVGATGDLPAAVRIVYLGR